MVHKGTVRHLRSRAPLLLLKRAEDVFKLCPSPEALLVDLEGTLTTFSPSLNSVISAIADFDVVAKQNGLDLNRIHYVTNATLKGFETQGVEYAPRVHTRAHKPFFTPPEEFCRLRHETIVVGDQYLTDGLMAYRHGLSFGLVKRSGRQPTWP